MSTRVPVQRSSREHLRLDRDLRAEDFVVHDKRVRESVQAVDRSGIATYVEERMASTTGAGRRRVLPWRPFFALLMLSARQQKGSLILTDADLVLHALTDVQRIIAGIPEGANYSHIESNLDDLAKAIDPPYDPVTGELLTRHVLDIDLDTFANWIVTGSIPDCIKAGQAAALDSTDTETYTRSRSRTSDGLPDVDEGGLPPEDMKPASAPNTPGWPRVGGDGRLQHTCDPDARQGFRSKKEGRLGIFTGHDTHTVVDVPDVGGAPVPGVIRAIAVRPAGSSKTAAGAAALKHLSATVRTILGDRGYSYRIDWAPALHGLGLAQHFDLHTNQRGVKPGPRDNLIWLDMALFTDAVPEDRRALALFRPMMSDREKLALAAEYDARAPFAYTPMGPPDKQGRRRFRGPALTGKVRCRNTPTSMRLKATQHRPTTACQRGVPCGCGITVTLPLEVWSRGFQSPIYGTTKWLLSYDRRTAVESGNAELKTNRFKFVRGSIRVKGITKFTILMAFIVAALNMQMLRDWFGADWSSLLDLDKPPERLVRRGTMKLSKHAAASGSPPG